MGSRAHASATAAATAAGQARDDDAEQGDDGVDDGRAGGANGANDRHDGITDRAEDGLNLEREGTLVTLLVKGIEGRDIRRRLRHPWLRIGEGGV